MADKCIDIKGLVCPHPVMKAWNALKTLEDEQVLEVVTDYEPAVKLSIPKLCEKKGYFLEVKDNEDGSWTLLITKNPSFSQRFKNLINIS